MLDAAFAGLERKSSKDKKRIVKMIEKQENLIQLLKRHVLVLAIAILIFFLLLRTPRIQIKLL